MAGITRYAAVNTKVHALEARLLTNQDFNRLLSMDSVAKAAEYLKENTAYRSVLEGVDIQRIQPKQLEILVRKYTVGQIQKLVHYFTGEYRRFFRLLLLRYEIEDLKIYLRMAAAGDDLSKARELTVLWDQSTGFDREGLGRSKNIRDLVENLKDTDYYSLLKPYLDEKPGQMLFHMEMALDRMYFSLLGRQVQRLDQGDREAIGGLLGKNTDLLNLQWIYRGLRFYKLPPEVLLNYTLSFGYGLSFKKLKALCYSEGEKQLIDKMIHSRYGFLFDNEDTLDIFMERRMERHLYFLLLKYKRRGEKNIIASNVYIHLLEFEARDISSVIESVRYRLGPDKAKGFLIRKI